MTTILAFLAARPWLKFALGVVVALVLLFAFIYLITASMDRALESSHSEGVAEEQRNQATATIRNTEKANAAAAEVRGNSAARNDQCVRYANNPDDC